MNFEQLQQAVNLLRMNVLSEYAQLMGLLNSVLKGEIAPDRVVLDTVNLTWSVTPLPETAKAESPAEPAAAEPVTEPHTVESITG